MAYQRGSIRKVRRKNGEAWVLRFREDTAAGGRRERVIPIGMLRDFPLKRDARKEIDRLGLLVSVNTDNQPGRVRFDALAEFYLKADFGEDAVREKSTTTIPIVRHYVRDYLIKRWGSQIAEDIKAIEIQRWLKALHKDEGLAWTTVSKIRGIMLRVYKIGIRHDRVEKNPVENTEARSKSDYKAIIVTPAQTFAILDALSGSRLHYTFVLTCAATALRSSEILSLRWTDILWDAAVISVSKRWAKGADGNTKTEASNGTVPLHPILAEYLKEWHLQTPYPKHADFVFPSLTKCGKVPIWSSTFVADHLRPAAKKAGVEIADGQRFGLHNLRHSLSNWLVNKAKVEPKTVQGILRHARIQTTLDLYTQDDRDEKQAAQGAYLSAVGLGSRLVQ
ncbi:MAG: tyrosine-type recombinase/integrase [Candidatus Korobacteraceae bacterium]